MEGGRISERDAAVACEMQLYCVCHDVRNGGQHLNIKRQCICSTDLNAEMVPALKNKSIMKQSNEEMCVNTNYSLRFREDSEILMHCQLLQRRLYNPDSFLCHKMHPTV